MLYRRSLEIDQRLNSVLRLIRSGRYSTPSLAENFDWSIPTVSWIIAALPKRGHEIWSERTEGGSRYFLTEDETPVGGGNQTNIAEIGRDQVKRPDCLTGKLIL